MGDYALALSDYAAARAWLEEGLALYRQVAVSNTAYTLPLLGELARLEGDYARAQTLNEEALELRRRMGTRATPSVLCNLGWIALRQGQLVQSAQRFAESLLVSQEFGRRTITALCVAGLGGVAAARGAPERGARLCAAAEAALSILGVRLDPADRLDLEQTLEVIRARLDPDSFDAAYGEGRKLTLDDAAALALEQAQEPSGGG